MTQMRAGFPFGLFLLVALAGCGADEPDSEPVNNGDCATTRLLVTTSDFSKGGLGVFDLETSEIEMSPDDLDQADTIPDIMGCAPVLLSRKDGFLHIQSQDDPRKTVRSVDLNPGVGLPDYSANPQRVVYINSEKAYVILSGTNEVVVVNPSTGETAGRISLERLAWDDDQDGVVDALDAVVTKDNKVVLALGQYWYDADQKINFVGSELAIVDATTDALVAVTADSPDAGIIQLQGQNPWRGMAYDSATNVVFVADSGETGGETPVLDGGIEAIDLNSGTSSGFVITEETLGAEINGFARVSANRLLVLAGRSVVSVDPTTGAAATATPVLDDADGIKVVGNDLFVWKTGGGLRRYDATTGAETTNGEPFAFGNLPVYGVSPSP